MKKCVFVQRCVFALSAGLVLLAAACAPIDSTPTGDLVKVLTPFGSELVVPLPGTLEDLSFNVEAQGSWKLEVRYEGEQKDYVQVRPASGGAGNHQVTLTVLGNSNDQSRACTLYITALKEGEEAVQVVRLSQEGVSLDLPAFVQGQGRIEIDPEGESGEFELARATADWQVETDASWIQVLPEAGKAFNVDPNQAEPAPAQMVSWTALSNPSATQTRTAHITFRAGQHLALTIEAVQGPRIPSLNIYGDANGLMPLGNVTVHSPAAGNTGFYVKANLAWTGQAHADWIQFNPESGQAGMTQVQAVLAPNPGAEEREGTLTFQTQGTQATLTFTQAGAQLTFPQGPFAFAPQALTDQAIAGDPAQSAVSNNNGLGWTATVTQGEEWLSCKASGASGEALTVTLLANEGPSSREGVITLQSGDISHTLTLSQAALASDVRIVSGSGAGNPIIQMENDFKGFSQPAGLRVKSPHAWTASVSAAWITLATTSGAANEAEGVALNFTAKPNPTGADREALITVTDGRGESGSVKTFKVTQKANPIPTQVPNGYTGEVPVLVATGGLQDDGKLPSGVNSYSPSRLYFTLTPDLTPSFSRSYSEVQSSQLNTAEKVIIFRDNTSRYDRSVTLRVTYNGYTFSWTITQSRGRLW